MDLVFFDTETTGLLPDNPKDPVPGIIEIACIRTTPDASRIIDEFETKIVLERDRYPVSEDALRINGYSDEKWAGAMKLEDAMFQVVQRMPFGVQLAGHNTSFDIGMLKASIRRAGMAVPKFYYHYVDTMSLGQPLVAKGHVDNVKLVTLSKFFGVPHEAAHTAMGDVKATLGVYRAILNYFPPGPEPTAT
jgi:DNA polymerase III alpha subunit (gram-positive type)